MDSWRRFLPLLLLAAAVGCSVSGSGDGSLSVRLEYPAPPSSPAADSRASARAASYPLDNTNRILIRVLAPHFAPKEAWFSRSDGRGVIGGLPPGTRITVEVDEFDNTATTLLGRGWCNGITLAAGETKTVPVAMYAKGTIVTICGAPPSAGSGTAGDSGDGGLDNEALLGNPVAVKVGPDDSIYVSSSAYGKVKRIDRYGYLSDFAGTGSHGAIVPGTAASSSPIGAVSDIDFDPAGNLYLFNYWNQIVRVDNGVSDNTVVNSVVYDNGIYNPPSRPNMAVVNTGFLYFVNYIEKRVYRLIDQSRDAFVLDNTPYESVEPIDRFHYPINGPSSIVYVSATNSLIFADTDNDRIMRISLLDGNIYYLAGYPGGNSFVENIDASGITLVKPWVVDYHPGTGKIFFAEQFSNRVLYLDAAEKVHLFAGNGTIGFSGDGGPATAARLNDPRGVTVDSRGNAYIADYGNHAIRMVVGGALP